VTAEQRIERLVTEAAPGLLGVLVRRCDVPADAADLLSEVYLVLWRRRAELPEDDSACRAWAFGIARGVLANARRSQRRRTALVERLRDRLNETHVAPEADVLDLRTTIDGLPAADRDLLLMVGLHDLTAVEAADVLGITPEALRQRLHRARGRLRVAMDASCPS
jgi:RNA polymerase sigma factor (sigma-70 family)